MGDWRNSSYSDGNGGACVETAIGNGTILVRDTTNRDGVTLSVSVGVWQHRDDVMLNVPTAVGPRFTASLR
jgi:Domain of unknown function (DUF397)